MTEPNFPARLARGAHVRVIAPSRSLRIINEEVRAEAEHRLGSLGLEVSFGAHVDVCDDFDSSPVEDRLADLHVAFLDPTVDGLLTVIGGYNSNQLLARVDYDLIADHPKALCGFSDITALGNALYSRTDLVTYSGPHFSSFGLKRHFEYPEATFRACLFADAPIVVASAAAWSDDPWFADQDERHLEPNDGWWVLNEGEANGTIVGGNLCTLNLLQGTPFMPSLEDAIVFVEDDAKVQPWDFDRDLVSLLQQPGFSGVRALVIGRFQPATGMTRHLLDQIIRSKPELSRMPGIANVDFGHTTPIITFPIGGTVSVQAVDAEARMTITSH